MIADPWAVWKLAVVSQETAYASWLTINERMWRFATGHKSSGTESWRMVTEKQMAFAQASWAWQRHMLRHWQPWSAPHEIASAMTGATSAALRPYRNKSRANARRLKGAKR